MHRNEGGRLLAAALCAAMVVIAAPAHWARAEVSPGRVMGTGRNTWGQLGDGTTVDSTTAVASLMASAVDVACGDHHTAALHPNGTAWTWGRNTDGQLGDGTTTDCEIPGQVPGLEGVIDVGCGAQHTLAVREDGTVWAWGYNGFGTLGDGTTTQRLSPVQVVDPGDPSGYLTGVVAVTGGRDCSIALKDDGTVWSWGRSNGGSLGHGGAGSSLVPVQVVQLTDPTGYLTAVTAIACLNYHTLALKVDGTVWCWGMNERGQLATGGTGFSNTAVRWGTIDDAVAVGAGVGHSAAVRPDGNVWTAGGNDYGQLGDGTTTERHSPVRVVDPDDASGYLTGVHNVACGYYHTIAMPREGPVQAWGRNNYGQLGDGTQTGRSTPVEMVGVRNGSRVAASSSQTMVIVPGPGSVLVSGDGDFGQRGDGIWSDTSVAVQSLMAEATQVKCGSLFTAALKADGSVWTWGHNGYGELGDGTTVNRNTPAVVAGLPDIVALATGHSHVVALADGGGVWAWGANDDGQLGDGTTTQRTLPVRVQDPSDPSGYLSGVVKVEAGESHSVALKGDGTVWTWGRNQRGQLGDGTYVDRLAPVQVVGPGGDGRLMDAVAIAAGQQFTLALLADRTLVSWGCNILYELGDGTTVTSRPTPAVVGNGFSDVVHVSASLWHAQAVRAGGTVWAWGCNDNGELGDGTTTDRNLPVQVVDPSDPSGHLTGVVSAGGGYWHTMAVKADGTVWAWGGNDDGQLGDGTTTERHTPVQMIGVSGAAQVDGGYGHSAVLIGPLPTPYTLTVQADPSWGGSVTVEPVQAGYSYGQVVHLSATADPGMVFRGWVDSNGTVVNTSLAETAVIMTASNTVTAKFVEPGTVVAWGGNDRGQLGDNSTSDRWLPVEVVTTGGLQDAVAVSGGADHSLALRDDGKVFAWGSNDYGQLGINTTVEWHQPVQVAGLSNAVAVAAGSDFSLALRRDGTVWAWGFNAFGQLGYGTGTDHHTPVQVSGLCGIVAIAAGRLHALALANDGSVWAWGENLFGQLGDGTMGRRYTPVQVSGLTSYIGIAAGEYYSLALKSDGSIWSWGRNNSGQLGDGTTTNRSIPVHVSDLADCVALAGGWEHSLALTSGGTVWAWGRNYYGALGDGTTTERHTPVLVSAPSPIVAVAGGGLHTLALGNDGAVWAWGRNVCGVLGDGTTTDRHVPTRTHGLANAIRITGGGGHSLAIVGALPATYTLTTAANPPGAGSVTRTPDEATYGYGQAVALEAEAGPGYVFAGWTGDTASIVDVSARKTTVFMTGSHSVTATFVVPGTALAWGDNLYGQVGDGSTIDRTTPAAVSGFVDGVAASCGGWHTAALKGDGTMWCWGLNGHGQLGDGFTTDRHTPQQVLTDVLDVAAGAHHTVAARTDGTVWAWGYNVYGQVGDGSTNERHSPVQATVLTGIRAVAAGEYHSLALAADQTVWAWGSNLYGQAGDGTSGNLRTTAVQVGGLGQVVAIAAGGSHSLALRYNGQLYAWGRNNYGQLGDGGTTDRTSPVLVLSGVVAVAAGDFHTLAVLSDGTVRAWGHNNRGQLGDGSTTDRHAPVTVTGLADIVAVEGGGNHSVALTGLGRAYAWGYNTDGQLGDATTTQRNSPVQVGTLSEGAAIITAGYAHTAALLGPLSTYELTVDVSPAGSGDVMTDPPQGWYDYGQEVLLFATANPGYTFIGWSGDTEAMTDPNSATTSILMTGDYAVTAVFVGPGSALGFGQNTYCQLGDGTSTSRYTPVPVTGLGTAVAVSSGFVHTVALKSDGTVWCWGMNAYGQIGDGTTLTRYSAVQVTSLSDILGVSGGWTHTLAVRADGTAWAWGNNDDGQLGDGTTTNSSVPVEVSGLTNVIAVAAGWDHSVALLGDGTVRCWGKNTFGQLGNGTTTSSTTPVQTSTLTDIVAVAAGKTHTAALASDGTVWTWGYNSYGQLGDNTVTQRTSPIQVPGLADVVAIACGAYGTLALKSDGTLWNWGYNAYGQLGDGTTTNHRTPIQVGGLGTVVAMAAGQYHTLAVLSDGTVRAWGNNTQGQLGDGTTTNRLAPVAVGGLSSIAAATGGGYFTIVLVGPLPMYVLTITASPPEGGTVEPAAPVTDCRYGEPMALMATPQPGWAFAGWTGDIQSVMEPGAADTICFMTADCSVTANFVEAQTEMLEITAAVAAGEEWVYQNTETTTDDRHISTATITLVSEATPGEVYDISIADDGPGSANFTLGDVTDNRSIDDTLEVEILGGRTDASTIGAGGAAYNVTLTVEGQDSGQSDTAQVQVSLLRIGDIDRDGSKTGTDKQYFNQRLNNVATPYTDRTFDLDGSGGAPTGTDKQVMNQALNNVPLP